MFFVSDLKTNWNTFFFCDFFRALKRIRRPLRRLRKRPQSLTSRPSSSWSLLRTSSSFPGFRPTPPSSHSHRTRMGSRERPGTPSGRSSSRPSATPSDSGTSGGSPTWRRKTAEVFLTFVGRKSLALFSKCDRLKFGGKQYRGAFFYI